MDTEVATTLVNCNIISSHSPAHKSRKFTDIPHLLLLWVKHISVHTSLYYKQ